MADGNFAIRVEVQQSVAKDFAKIEKEVEDLKNSILKLNTKLAKTNKELERVKQQNALKSQAGQANFFASQMGTAIKKLIAYRTVFLTLRGLKNIFTETADDVIRMDTVLADLNKVMNTSEDNLLKLRDAAFGFAKAFGKPVSDVTAGFKIFAQQGLNTNQIIERTRTLMLAVSATTLTANQAVEALTAATRNFNIEGLQLVRVVDAWKAVESTAAVGAQDLANAMKQLAQIASIAGISLDFLNGIVAAVASVTRKSGQAIGTSFKTIFARLQSDQAVQAFQDLGVNVLDAEGALRPMEGLLKDLAIVWDDLTDGQKRSFALLAGGKRRYSDFVALMNNFKQATDSAAISQNAFGEAALAAQINAAKLEARLNTIKTAWQEVRVVVGEEAVKAFVSAAENIVPLLETLTENKEIIQDLLKTIGLLIATLGTLGGITVAIKSFLALKAAITAAFVATSSLTAGLFAISPFLLALGAIAVAGVAIYNAYSKIEAASKSVLEQSKKLTGSFDDEATSADKAATAIDARTTALEKAKDSAKLDPRTIALQENLLSLYTRQAEILSKIEGQGAVNPSIRVRSGTARGGTTAGRNPILPKSEVEDLNKEYNELTLEIEKSRAALSIVENEFVNAAKASQDLDDSTKRALIQIEKMANTIKILSEIDVIPVQFEAAREEADALNEPFDELKFKLNQLTEIQKKFNNEIVAVQTKIAEINRTIDTQTNNALLSEDKLRELKQKRTILQAQLVNLTAAELKFNQQNSAELGRIVDALEKQKSILESLPLAQFERNTAVREEIAALKSRQSIQEAILGSSLDQEKGLLAIQNTKIRIAENEAKVKLNELQAEIDLLDVAKDQENRNKLINQQSLIEKQLAEQKLAIERETTNELARQKIERDASLRGQIASNLINLPNFLTQRIEDEKLLEQERAQAEARLAEARAANDAAAIERAQSDIDDIENRIRDLASIAGTVAESFLKPFSDLFVERTMKEFVDTIFELKNSGSKLSDIFSGKETSDQVADAINSAGAKGASKFKAAIEAGAQAGALLLGQVLGGGGKGAGIGASIGGALGSILGPGGGVAGAIFGGLVGGLFDQDKKITASNAQRLADAIDKNTLAIENNNRLLELNREFINAPTRFEAPSTRGSAFGIGDINVVVNTTGGGSSAADIGNGVADVLEKRLSSALRATGSKASKLGNR